MCGPLLFWFGRRGRVGLFEFEEKRLIVLDGVEERVQIQRAVVR